MQIWDGHTGLCLMSPFIALYKKFIPSLDGLELYYRFVSLTISIIISLFNIHLLKKKFHDSDVYLYFIPFIFASPVLRFNYNTLTVLLMLTATNLIYTSEAKAPEKARYFAAGLISGLMCVNYPTCAVIALFMFFYIILHKGFTKGLFYSVGVILIGTSFFTWIFSNGSLDEFNAAVNYLTTSPFIAPKRAVLNFLYWSSFRPIVFYLVTYGFLLLAYFSGIYLIKREADRHHQSKYMLATYSMLLLISIFFFHGLSGERSSYITTILIALLPFSTSLVPESKKEIRLFYFIAIMFTIIYLLTSYNWSLLLGLLVAAPVVMFLICLVMYIYCQEKALQGINIRFPVVFVLIMLIFTGILNSYANIYGEAGGLFALGSDFKPRLLWKNPQVDKGMYKYIRTSPSKKEYLEQLQDFIQENIYPEDKLCVITLEPTVYAFTDAEIFTPWTFDVMYFWSGGRDSKLLLDYFEFYNEYPNVLVGNDRLNRDFYGNPVYKINSFIEEHYTLAASKKIRDITTWIWRLKK